MDFTWPVQRNQLKTTEKSKEFEAKGFKWRLHYKYDATNEKPIEIYLVPPAGNTARIFCKWAFFINEKPIRVLFLY
jgi:hypothetical protein